MTMHHDADALPDGRPPLDPAVRLLRSMPGPQPAPADDRRSTDLWLPGDPEGGLSTLQGRTSDEHFEDRVSTLTAELLDTDGLDSIAPLEPLLGDLLQMNTLARVVGPSGSFKSFVLLDMCGHIGTGTKWHGHYVRQGIVVYLVAEGEQGIRKRVRAWEQHYGLRMDGVLFLPRPVQAMDPEWDVMIEAVRRIGPVFIVVDTQARVTVGVEENSNTEMGRVIARLDQLRRTTGACVAPVHHTGHVGDHGRGASSVKGALQSELLISRKGDRLQNIVLTLKAGKQKDEEEGRDLQFGLKQIALDGEAKPDGRPVTSVVIVPLDAPSAEPREPIEGTVGWIVVQLDKHGVPNDWGRRRLQEECARLGIKARNDKLNEVAKARKERSPERSPASDSTPVPIPGTDSDETAAQTGPGPVGDHYGTGTDGPVVPSPSLRRGPLVPNGPQRFLCTICNAPLDDFYATHGGTFHAGCGRPGSPQ